MQGKNSKDNALGVVTLSLVEPRVRLQEKVAARTVSKLNSLWKLEENYDDFDYLIQQKVWLFENWN